MLHDLALACLSLSAAYLLRYEGVVEKRFVEEFVQLLPFMVLCKLPLLYLFGVYRSMWRYTGVRDVGAIARAGTLGSLLAVAAAFAVYRGEVLNRSVLLIDWVMFIILAVGTRLSFVFMRDLLARLRRHGVTRVLIVGANDSGELILRATSRSRRGYRVVGFLDDDPTKQHLAIHGIKVIGTTEQLAAAVARRSVQEVLVATGSAERRADLLGRCRELGIPARDLGQFFLDQADGEGAADGGRGTADGPAAAASSGRRVNGGRVAHAPALAVSDPSAARRPPSAGEADPPPVPAT